MFSRSYRRLSRTVTLVALAASTTTVFSACSAPGGGGGGGGVSFDSLGHIHAVDLDVQAGILYIATHNGVWEVDVPDLAGGFPQASSVQTRQIANRAQDTMGFTITEEGVMFASGHPDPEEYPDFNPPNLGLIRSTDGAETWEHISLQEETDFHALTATALEDKHFRIYGYDSTAGVLRISDDTGKTWRVGADIEAIDLAAMPGNPNVLYASTTSGLQRSTDAGKTFTPASPNSTLMLIEPLSTGVVGVDSTGSIWRTDGDTMSKTGAVNGAFDAFGAVEDEGDLWLFASDDSGLGVSDDGGKSWTNIIPR